MKPEIKWSSNEELIVKWENKKKLLWAGNKEEHNSYLNTRENMWTMEMKIAHCNAMILYLKEEIPSGVISWDEKSPNYWKNFISHDSI
jgi:hypothetical protein